MIAFPLTTDIVVRPMRLEDLRQVQEIDRASFSLPWPPSSYRYELVKNQYSLLYVAEAHFPSEAPRVVGMIVVWLIVDEAHIATLAVHPGYRRQGISQRMLTIALRESIRKGAHLATLEVRSQNKIAQALYQRFRFKVVGRRPRYYQDNNEDALLMMVNLRQTDEQGLTYMEWLASPQWDQERGEAKPSISGS